MRAEETSSTDVVEVEQAPAEKTEIIEEVTPVDETTWTEVTLPEPWPQDFHVQSGMEILSQEGTEGNLVLVAQFSDGEEYGIFDTYDFYYDACGWEHSEELAMSCMSDGASLTVYVVNEDSQIHIDGNFIDGLFTLTYTLTPIE